MNKAELIESIAKTADVSKAAATRALDGTIKAISLALKKGDVVTLVGFGSFYVGKRTARIGRNPRTGAAIKIKAKTAQTDIFTFAIFAPRSEVLAHKCLGARCIYRPFIVGISITLTTRLFKIIY